MCRLAPPWRWQAALQACRRTSVRVRALRAAPGGAPKPARRAQHSRCAAPARGVSTSMHPAAAAALTHAATSTHHAGAGMS